MAVESDDANRLLIEMVTSAAARRILYLPHAISQMNLPERMISATEVRSVIRDGTVIEDYPQDPRGHSCLMLGQGSGGRHIHVVCAPKREYLAVITAYLPSPREWEAGFRIRKRR